MRYLSIFSLAMTGLMACNQGSTVAQDPVTMHQTLQSLEAEIEKAVDVNKNREASIEFIDQSQEYARLFPADTLAPSYLFSAAGVARGIGEYGKAVKLWGKVWREYGDYVNAPAALFLQGFTAENDLQDKEMAVQYYREMMKRYPEHPYADQARQLIQLINIPPEELIRQFEQNRKDN